MGKQFSGNLMIEEGKKKGILVKEFGKTLYPNAEKRTNFTEIDETGAVYIEDGEYTENNQKVYYFTGNVDNNWVKFGKDGDNDLYWRIIRTNEDGGLRLLYAGTEPNTQEGYIKDGSTTTFKYNSNYNNTTYVGYKYGDSSSLEKNRGNNQDSDIKQTIDKWYSTTINGKSDGNSHNYSDYVSKTAIYCNDRSGDNWGTSTMYYAAYYRLVQNKNHPSFKCGLNTTNNKKELYNDAKTSGGREKDMFSVSKTSGGNGELTYPVALMTADEIVFAGGLYGQDSQSYYYLNSSNSSVTGTYYWWTMSPYDADSDGWAGVFGVNGSGYPGYLSNSNVRGSGVVRPVLSLKSCVQLSGSGTTGDPYIPHIDDTCVGQDN